MAQDERALRDDWKQAWKDEVARAEQAEQAARELWAAAVLLFNDDDAQVMKAAGEVIGRWKPLVGVEDAWEVVKRAGDSRD